MMKRRPGAWLFLCAVIGAQWGFYWPQTMAFLCAAVTLIVFTIIVPIAVVRIASVLLFTIALVGGVASVTKNHHHELMASLPTTEMLFHGTVDTIVSRDHDSMSAVARLRPANALESTAFRVVITFTQAMATMPITPKQSFVIKTTLRPLRQSLSPVLFDEQCYGLVNNIHARATIAHPTHWWSPPEQSSPSSFAAVNQLVRERTLRAVLPKDAALLLALMIGDTQLIEEEQTALYRNLGAQHLLAVSGLQITLLAAIFFGFFTLLFRSFLTTQFLHHSETLASLITISFIYCFTGLADFTSSAMRAFLMASFMFAPQFIARRVDIFDAFFASGLLTMLLWPTNVLDLGYLLSYAACFGLMIVHARGEKLYRRIRSRSRIIAWLVALIVSSGAAFLSTLPFLLWHIGSIAPLSMLSNFFLLPIACIAQVPAILFGLLGVALDSSILLSWAAWCSSLIELWAEVINAMTGLVVTIKTQSLLSITAISAACVACFLINRTNYRVVTTIIGMLILTCAVDNLAPKTEFEATVIPVGQGDATLFFMPPNFTMLVDAGGEMFGTRDPGEKIVVPTLLRKGIAKLDVLVISHPDPDHILGAFAVLEHIRVKEIWHSGFALHHPLTKRLLELALKKQIRVREIKELIGRHQFGATELYVLAPKTNTDEAYFSELSANDNSLVLRFVYQNYALLWPGDLEYFGEQLLISSKELIQADVVKAPHHGSKTSSSTAFIGHVSPRHVIYTTGYNNRFGFPHDIVVQRYRSVYAKEWDTSKDGEIVITIKNQKMMVSRYARSFEGRGKLLPWHNKGMTS